MSFISAEEFMKQPEKTCDTLFNWWKPQTLDKVYYVEKQCETCIWDSTGTGFTVICEDSNGETKEYYIDKEDLIPLLAEGQLRQFIEEKTKSLIKIDTMPCNYYVTANCKHSNGGHDLLQEYWNVACQIIKGELHD